MALRTIIKHRSIVKQLSIINIYRLSINFNNQTIIEAIKNYQLSNNHQHNLLSHIKFIPQTGNTEVYSTYIYIVIPIQVKPSPTILVGSHRVLFHHGREDASRRRLNVSRPRVVGPWFGPGGASLLSRGLLRCSVARETDDAALWQSV